MITIIVMVAVVTTGLGCDSRFKHLNSLTSQKRPLLSAAFGHSLLSNFLDLETVSNAHYPEGRMLIHEINCIKSELKALRAEMKVSSDETTASIGSLTKIVSSNKNFADTVTFVVRAFSIAWVAVFALRGCLMVLRFAILDIISSEDFRKEFS